VGSAHRPERHGAQFAPMRELREAGSARLARSHSFHAFAFAENLTFDGLKGLYEGAEGTPHEISAPIASGRMFLYPFGAVVMQDISSELCEQELARLLVKRPEIGSPVKREEFTVQEDARLGPAVGDGRLTIDRLTPERASVVALTVAQSVAMEYYEGIVEEMFTRTRALVDGLEADGTVAPRIRELHRFIGHAVATRTEVLAVLHLLDRPDEAWDDSTMDRIYAQLQAEFDLVDRYAALESKLRGVHEALQLVLDVARDRRLVLLEVSVVVLIVLEIVLSLTRGH